MLYLLFSLLDLHILQLFMKIIDLSVAIFHERFGFRIAEVFRLIQSSDIGINELLDFFRKFMVHIIVIPLRGCPT